jgi:F-type H+-transporting ATPase subunit a
MLTVDQVEQLLNVWHFPITPGALIPGPWHWGKIGGFSIDVDAKTMVMTWITMVIVAVFGVAATRRMDIRKPHGLQNVMEMIYEGMINLTHQSMDPVKAAPFISVVTTFFIFILFSNMLGLVPTLSSPTADYQTTLALGLITFVLIYVFGFRFTHGRFMRHFLTPFLPLTIIEELAKPITLAFRLYGNIFAGEMLIMVLLGLLGGWVHVFGGFIASVAWLAFSIFVGFIQTFIFVMLSIAYVSAAVAEEHH